MQHGPYGEGVCNLSGECLGVSKWRIRRQDTAMEGSAALSHSGMECPNYIMNNVKSEMGLF